MINGDEGLIDGDSDGFGGGETDQQRAGEAGTVGGGDGIEFEESRLGLRKSLLNNSLDER